MLTLHPRAHDSHHVISVAALTGVLQRASQRKRSVKEQEAARTITPEKKMSGGLPLMQSQPGQSQGEGQETSRSDSQMSIAASQFPQQQSSTTVSSEYLWRHTKCFMRTFLPCSHVSSSHRFSQRSKKCIKQSCGVLYT